MLKVEIFLNNEFEVNLLSQFTEILRKGRETAQQQAAPTADASYEVPPVPIGVEDIAAPAVEEETSVVGFITPEAAGTAISDATLIEAFQKFAASKPMPELVALLKSFGASKVSEITQDKRLTFLQAVTV